MKMTNINERKLILLVKKYPELYDNSHEKFSDLEHKKEIWKNISSKLSVNENECCTTWINLKYDYQIFIQKLNSWMKKKQKIKRPKIKYEEDMIFLWRFIPKTRRRRLKKLKNVQEFKFIDPIYDFENVCAESISRKEDQKLLLEAISHYPELYNKMHPYYDEPTRKGLIWVSIAEEVKMDVFKCMYTWFQLKEAHEYFLTTCQKSNKSATYKYDKDFEFYTPFIDMNEIENSKGYYVWLSRRKRIDNDTVNISVLLNCVKDYPYLNERLHNKTNITNNLYLLQWLQIANKLNSTASICERCFSVLKNTFREICIINSGEYKLQKKWPYENLLANFCLPPRYKFETTVVIDNSTDNITNSEKCGYNKYPFNRNDCLNLIKNVKIYPELYLNGKYFVDDESDDTNDFLWSHIGRIIGNYPGVVCRRYWCYILKLCKNYIKKIMNKEKNIVEFPFVHDLSFVLENCDSIEAEYFKLHIMKGLNPLVTVLSKPTTSLTAAKQQTQDTSATTLRTVSVSITPHQAGIMPITKAPPQLGPSTRSSTVTSNSVVLPQISEVFSLAKTRETVNNTITTIELTSTSNTSMTTTTTKTTPLPLPLLPEVRTSSIKPFVMHEEIQNLSMVDLSKSLFRLENILHFIRIMKDYPLLCNQTDLGNTNLDLDTWEQISNKSSVPVEKCAELWSILRDKYLKYLHLNKEFNIVLPKEILSIYDEMKFLSEETSKQHLLSTEKNNLIRSIDSTDIRLPINISDSMIQNSQMNELVQNHIIFSNELKLKNKDYIINMFKSVKKDIFVKNVKNYKCLYCSVHKDYKSLEKKVRAWKDISFLMNLSVFECLIVWQFLSEQFKQHRKDNKKLLIKKWVDMYDIEQCLLRSKHTHEDNSIQSLRVQIYAKRVAKFPLEYQLEVFKKVKLMLNEVIKNTIDE